MTIASISLDPKRAIKYAKFLQRAPEIFKPGVEGTLRKVLLLLEREIKDDTPVGVGGGSGLRGSITHELRGTLQKDLQGKVYSPLAHAVPVEYGTKPHLPPWPALMDWVEHKLGITDPDEIVGISIAIALKIKAHGTEGAHMFERNFNKNAPQISQKLNAAIDRVFARLEKGQ